MKDAYSFDLSDDGLRGVLRRSMRAAYQRIFDRLGLRLHDRGGACPARWAARRRRSSWPRRRSARTPSSAAPRATTRPTPRRWSRRRRRPATRRRSPPATAHDTPDTPTIESLVDAGQRPRARRAHRLGRRRHAEERGRHGDHARARAARTAGRSACPATARWTCKRLDAALRAGDRGACSTTAPRRPELVRGYIGPQVLAKLGIRYLVDPRVVARHRVADRRQRARPARGQRGVRPRLHPGRHDRGGRGARRRPVPGLRRRAR